MIVAWLITIYAMVVLTVIAWLIIICLMVLPIRLASRRRPPTVVVVVQIPAPPPQAPLTLEQEWARLDAGDGGA